MINLPPDLPPLVTVSYTHLDVYKRQGISKGPALALLLAGPAIFLLKRMELHVRRYFAIGTF